MGTRARARARTKDTAKQNGGVSMRAIGAHPSGRSKALCWVWQSPAAGPPGSVATRWPKVVRALRRYREVPTGRSAEAGALSAQVTGQPLLVEARLIRIRITDLRRRRRCCHPHRELPRSASEQWRQGPGKSRRDDQIVGRCRPQRGQRSAPARTAGKLPGGDIFLDLLSSRSSNRDLPEPARQITTGGALLSVRGPRQNAGPPAALS